MPKLVIKTGNAATPEYELKNGVNTIGRGPLNDFRVEDPSVSSAHAEITVETNCVTVKDLRSTNGTFINRSQIREGFLQGGQLLSLGAVDLLYMAEETAAQGQGAVARTIALPQVGGIKISRPASPAGGFSLPNNYPVPTAPAPNLTTTPTPLTPGPLQPAATTRQAQPVPPAAIPVAAPARPAPVAARPAPAVSVEDRTWKHVPVIESAPSVLRCLGFGLGMALICGMLWTLVAAMTGIAPGPVGLAATGLFSGFALRMSSRGGSGAAFALLAVGCALVGMCFGELGQLTCGMKTSFEGINLLALTGGIVAAALIGGFSFAPKTARA